MEFSLSIYRSDKMEIIEFMKKGDLYEIAKKHKKIHRMPLSKLSKPELEKIVLDLSKHEQVGSGIIEDFKNFGKKLVDKAKQIFFFPPNKLPVSSEKVFNVYKGETITGIEVRREPLTGAISKVADWVSGGKYTEKLKDLGYDKVFHLYMILKFGNRKVLIEKNERINITYGR